MTKELTVQRYVTALYHSETGEVKSAESHGFNREQVQRRVEVMFLLHVGEEWAPIGTVAIPEDATQDEIDGAVRGLVDHFNASGEAGDDPVGAGSGNQEGGL